MILLRQRIEFAAVFLLVGGTLMSTTRGTQMTAAEIAALVGLIAVIVMSVIMAIEVVRGGIL